MTACSFSRENYLTCSVVSGIAGTLLTAAAITTAMLPAVYAVTTVALPIFLSLAALAAWILFAISLVKSCQSQQAANSSQSRVEEASPSQEETLPTDNEIKSFLDSLQGRDPSENDRIKFESYINEIGVNQPFLGDNTLLMYIAKVGHPISFVKILAEHGADFNYREPEGGCTLADNTSLIWAIANAQNEMALELMNYPQNLDISGNFGNTALLLAVAKGYDHVSADGNKLDVSNLQLVTTLLQKGANPNVTNENGYSPLHLAVIRRHEAMVKVLLEQGAHIDFDWQKALNCSYEEACNTMYRNSFVYLLDKGQFEASKDKVESLLKSKQPKKRVTFEEAENLLQRFKNADPTDADVLTFHEHLVGLEKQEDKGALLIRLAQRGRPLAFIKVFAECGASFDFQEDKKNTALIWAVANAQNEFALKMLDHSQNLDIQGGLGNTALSLAVAKGYETVTKDGQKLSVSNLQLVAALLKKGANPNKKNAFGYSALHLAVIRRHEPMVKLLLEHGAKIDFNWQEALDGSYEQACFSLDESCIAYLLEKQSFLASHGPVATLLQDPKYAHKTCACCH